MEDNPGDIYLVREALLEHGFTGPLSVLHDGEAAIEFIESLERDPSVKRPALLILDLNLPRKGGWEVLRRWREGACSSVPAVVLSSSNAPADRTKAHDFGARLYIVKPSSLDEFMAIGGVLREVVLGGGAG